MAEYEGLSNSEARRLLQEFGPNELPETPPPSRFEIFMAQLKSPLVYVLLGAGAVTFLLGEIPDTVIIGFAVFLNTILGYIQEEKANNALQALKEMVHPRTTVFREGKRETINIEDVVPGDICVLNSGDKVPADGEVLKASHFFVSEAILTGESSALEKSKGDSVYMGTVVTAGRAYVKVQKTGEETEMGKIALRVQEVQSETPLRRQLAHFSKQLTFLTVGLVVSVFVIGFFSGKDLVEVFLTSVALAVSSIPEGLLVALTVVLAIGMQRILKRKGLVRNLVSAETLGGVTTICADKTGTLTEGNMRVVRSYGNDKDLARQVYLTNDLDDPIVLASYEWGKGVLKNQEKSILAKAPRIDELPFSSKDRFVATLHKEGKEKWMYVNGAPEFLLEWSKVSKAKRAEIEEEIELLTKDGMRLMGMARKKITKKGEEVVRKDVVDGNLEWVGFLAFSDPVRKGVSESLAKTRLAGIRLVVITGDYADTAKAVLKQLKVEVADESVILGKQLAKMNATKLSKLLKGKNTILFARTTPEQKLKIVEALKKNGEVVAMTGDGVNDAPALSRADIGIVVGSATEVAKESSDLVLLDSSFATIVAAIEEGRGIFENIRKVILFLMSDAFEGIFATLGSIVLSITLVPGLPLPVTAAQILWINLISDGFPNLSLTIDPKREGIMSEPPRDTNEQLVNRWMKQIILIVSISGGIMALGIFVYNFVRYDDPVLARSVAFATLGVNSSIFVFSVRRLADPFWKGGFFDNKWLIVAVLASFVLQFAPFVYRPLGDFLEVVPLSVELWTEVFAASIIMFILIEVSKYFYRMHLFEK